MTVISGSEKQRGGAGIQPSASGGAGEDGGSEGGGVGPLCCGGLIGGGGGVATGDCGGGVAVGGRAASGAERVGSTKWEDGEPAPQAQCRANLGVGFGPLFPLTFNLNHPNAHSPLVFTVQVPGQFPFHSAEDNTEKGRVAQPSAPRTPPRLLPTHSAGQGLGTRLHPDAHPLVATAASAWASGSWRAPPASPLLTSWLIQSMRLSLRQKPAEALTCGVHRSR